MQTGTYAQTWTSSHTHTHLLTRSLAVHTCSTFANVRNSSWCKYLLKTVSNGIQRMFPCKISFWRPAEGSSQNIFITLQSRSEHWHRVHFSELHSWEVLRALGSHSRPRFLGTSRGEWRGRIRCRRWFVFFRAFYFISIFVLFFFPFCFLLSLLVCFILDGAYHRSNTLQYSYALAVIIHIPHNILASWRANVTSGSFHPLVPPAQHYSPLLLRLSSLCQPPASLPPSPDVSQ